MHVTKMRVVFAVLAVFVLAAILVLSVGTAAAHHAGNNPDVGYINEEMVHNGLMNNAADQGYWNEPWSEVQTDLDPPGTTNQNMLGEQTQNGRD